MTPAEHKTLVNALWLRNVAKFRVGRITPTFTKLLSRMPRHSGVLL